MQTRVTVNKLWLVCCLLAKQLYVHSACVQSMQQLGSTLLERGSGQRAEVATPGARTSSVDNGTTLFFCTVCESGQNLMSVYLLCVVCSSIHGRSLACTCIRTHTSLGCHGRNVTSVHRRNRRLLLGDRRERARRPATPPAACAESGGCCVDALKKRVGGRASRLFQ